MFKNVIRLSVYAILYAILPYALISCNSGEAKQPAIQKQDTTLTALVDKAANEGAAAQADADFKNYPLDFINDSSVKKYPATLLTTGTFHEDEVDKEDTGRSWYGLFLNADGYYLDTTRIVTKRVQDPVLDEEEGKTTGWEVKTTNKDTSFLLIAGINGLEKRQIKQVNLRKNEIMPGESITYSHNGITYTLYATGNKTKEKPEDDYYNVTNYRLFIKATINGSERTQLLVATAAFDDAMVDIQFAGDIDGDNIPDLIINTSYHYNVIVPTLYLSKPAGGKDILKVMGWHVSVGC